MQNSKDDDRPTRHNVKNKSTIPQYNHRKHPHYPEKKQRTTNKIVPKENSCTKNSRIGVVGDAPTSNQTKKENSCSKNSRIRVVGEAPTSNQTKKRSKKKSRNKKKKENVTPARDKVPALEKDFSKIQKRMNRN